MAVVVVGKLERKEEEAADDVATGPRQQGEGNP